jgi:hypothetical protein
MKEVEKMTVAEIKREMTKLKIPVPKGNKASLVALLRKHFEGDDDYEEEDEGDDYEDEGGDDYQEEDEEGDDHEGEDEGGDDYQEEDEEVEGGDDYEEEEEEKTVGVNWSKVGNVFVDDESAAIVIDAEEGDQRDEISNVSEKMMVFADSGRDTTISGRGPKDRIAFEVRTDVINYPFPLGSVIKAPAFVSRWCSAEHVLEHWFVRWGLKDGATVAGYLTVYENVPPSGEVDFLILGVMGDDALVITKSFRYRSTKYVPEKSDLINWANFFSDFDLIIENATQAAYEFVSADT